MASLPVRGPAVRTFDLPLPPARMALVRDGRPLKRWRYVGVFGDDLILCAAEVFVGPLAQRFWAVAGPDGRSRQRRALVGSGGLRLGEHGVVIAGRAVRADLALRLDEPGIPPAVESVSPSGRRGYVWTRKQAGVPVRGDVDVDGRRRTIEAEAVIDDTAGYHPRHTEWRWSAGVGRGAGGERVGWNLVDGVNDDPVGSERTMWIDGRPEEIPPVGFSDDLRSVRFGGGTGELCLRPWSAIAHRTRLGLVRSDYRQPFGEVEGELPGGLRLVDGRGVLEHHEARW